MQLNSFNWLLQISTWYYTIILRFGTSLHYTSHYKGVFLLLAQRRWKSVQSPLTCGCCRIMNFMKWRGVQHQCNSGNTRLHYNFTRQWMFRYQRQIGSIWIWMLSSHQDKQNSLQSKQIMSGLAWMHSQIGLGT